MNSIIIHTLKCKFTKLKASENGLVCQYLQVNIMLHQSHPSISGPALLIVVAHNVLIVGIRVFSKVALDQISGFISRKPEKTRIPLSPYSFNRLKFASEY